MSTTVAVVRLIGNLLKDKTLGPRIVPIVADEARTFGMANLFRQVGIYSSVGQLYEPEDANSMLYYRESKDGQLLEEGITEAGALSSWVAAATSYSVHGLAMLPVYIFYSMFGFQRVGDLIWAAADQRARGFLIGATAGRTTLAGEGLQHQDGSSHLLAATIPNCRAYDPAFAYEMAVILDHGVRSMMEEGKDEFYYITAMNENYTSRRCLKTRKRVLSRASTSSRRMVRRNAAGLSVCSARARSFRKLSKRQRCWTPSGMFLPRSGARPVTPSLRGTHGRSNAATDLIHSRSRSVSHLGACLPGAAPIIAASDYVRAYPQMIASYVDARFIALGTDGFGRSDTRRALRAFFEVDRYHIVIAALDALATEGLMARQVVAKAIDHYGVKRSTPPPWSI